MTMNDPTQHNKKAIYEPLFWLLMAGCLAIILGFLWVGFEATVESQVFSQAKKSAAEKIETRPAPYPVRVSLLQCADGIAETDQHLARAGYEPHALDYFRGIEPNVIAAMTEIVIEDCAADFVLAGGTLEEMTQRAQVLEPMLPEAFADGALAQALEQAE